MFCLCSAYLSISQQNTWIKYVSGLYLHCQACCCGCPSQYQGWCVRVCRWMSAVRRCLPCVHPGMDFTRRMWSLWTLACFLSCVHQTPGHVGNPHCGSIHTPLLQWCSTTGEAATMRVCPPVWGGRVSWVRVSRQLKNGQCITLPHATAREGQLCNHENLQRRTLFSFW